MSVHNPADVFEKPFPEWSSSLRRAFLEGWQQAKLATGKTCQAVIREAGPGILGVLAGAAWTLGFEEAKAQ